jgi:hypothetical protein
MTLLVEGRSGRRKEYMEDENKQPDEPSKIGSRAPDKADVPLKLGKRDASLRKPGGDLGRRVGLGRTIRRRSRP